ncbi:MAG: LysR family transcriptional regulator [Steroidobacteraceae bacterium]
MAELKLKDLRYLVAVADTRHFGRAAARCFVSQPALSATLRKLEERSACELVERAPRRIALTEAGEAVARARTRHPRGHRRHRHAGAIAP